MAQQDPAGAAPDRLHLRRAAACAVRAVVAVATAVLTVVYRYKNQEHVMLEMCFVVLLVGVVDAAFAELLAGIGWRPAAGSAFAYLLGGAIAFLPAMTQTAQLLKVYLCTSLALAALGLAMRATAAERGGRLGVAAWPLVLVAGGWAAIAAGYAVMAHVGHIFGRVVWV